MILGPKPPQTSVSTKYSVCITNYNTIGTLTKSLDSLLAQLDDRFEVIVVDNRSTDGSLSILRTYESRGTITLLVQKCSIGEGRQIALEHSRGEYLILNVDMDDVYKPVLREILSAYHSHFEGDCLLFHGLAVCPRNVAYSVGGYRNLQYGEDFDFYSRCARIDRLKYVDFETRVSVGSDSIRSFRGLVYRYQRARDKCRMGLDPRKGFSGANLLMNAPLIGLGYLVSRVKGKYQDYPREFDVWAYRTDLPPELGKTSVSSSR